MPIEKKHVIDAFVETTGDTDTDDSSDSDDDDDGVSSERVRECLRDGIQFFHGKLPGELRSFIHDKWGISDDMIDARRIGFTGADNDVVEFLRDEGYRPVTIVKAGLGTSPLLKHVFGCGVSPGNAHVVDDTDDADEYIDESCSHEHVPVALDMLVYLMHRGDVDSGDVDVAVVGEHIERKAKDGMKVFNWWDERITFPYKNRDGEWSYLIGRATDDTNDIIYNNGITDVSGEKLVSVADTRLIEDVPFSRDELEEFVVVPYYRDVFDNPDEPGNESAAAAARDAVVAYRDGDVGHDALVDVGVTHEPGAVEHARENDIARVTVVDVGSEDGVVLSPPAVGVEPGASVSFVNRLDTDDVELVVDGTPDGVWWDGDVVDETGLFTVSEPGVYRYHVVVDGDAGDGGEELHGMLVVHDDVYVTRRNRTVESWVGDEPNFEVDLAKYVKQSVDRAWIDRDVIDEPIFGVETVHDGASLVVTEGVTDAIMAHQHNFPCVAPATTNFKKQHYEEISRIAERVDTVFVVNDTELNDAGINGALRTAKVLENDGHSVLVGELPLPDGERKIDIAEFLRTHGRDEFRYVLSDAVPPEEHRKYDPSRHDPAFKTRVEPRGTGDGDVEGGVRGRAGGDPVPESELSSSNVSELYSLTLRDVIDWSGLDSGNRGGSTVYRGVNPLGHHGSSKGYFVIRDHGGFVTAKDYKIESSTDGYYYNALTWLATAAECPRRENTDCRCRDVRRPMGSLSGCEVFAAWRHAKQTSYIPVSEDDSIPLKALWWVVEEHELLPDGFAPESFDEEPLPDSVYNKALDVVRDEYGLEPGRDRR